MKNNILLILIFVSGAVFGGVVSWYFWMKAAEQVPCTCALPRSEETNLLLAQLEQAALPDDVQEPQEETRPQRADEMPSQLVRTDWPEDLVMGAQPQAGEMPAKPAGVVLDDTQNTVVLNAKRPPHRAADGSSITMIEAPVAAKRITSLDEYKAFKREARGSYPQADFAKEEVLVLESQSNLPDKVFEIVEIIPGPEDVKVMYRVNMFGLDKKTNTHSAQKMPKTKLPVVLEQVL